MELILTATMTFAGTLLALGFIEVSAENMASWNTNHAAGYFWSIEPDPKGSEAQRLAYKLAGTPLARTDMELCRMVDGVAVAETAETAGAPVAAKTTGLGSGG